MASYEETFDFNFRILRFLGLWNIKTNSVLKNQLYFFHQCFAILFLALFNILCYVDLYFIRHDIEKFNFNLCAVTATTMTLFKTLRALEKLPEINRLTYCLQRNLEEEKDEVSKRKILKAVLEMNFLNKVYYSMTGTLMTIWMLTPLLDYNSGERKLPFRQWFPFNIETSPNYEIVYIYQVISGLVISNNIVSSDLATYGFMIRISAEYDVLIGNIEKLNKLYEETLNDEEILRIIKNCVVHHQEIILRTRQFEEVYNKTIMIQFLGCTFLLAVVGFDVTVMSTDFNMRFITQLVYLFVAMFNLFLFCLYGTRLQYKSYDIFETIFHTPWYLVKSKLRSYLSFMILKAQQPPIVTGGKILTINFNAFLKVLRTTYNMLALFRQITSKNK